MIFSIYHFFFKHGVGKGSTSPSIWLSSREVHPGKSDKVLNSFPVIILFKASVVSLASGTLFKLQVCNICMKRA
jgi:hypothetical protein